VLAKGAGFTHKHASFDVQGQEAVHKHKTGVEGRDWQSFATVGTVDFQQTMLSTPM